MFSKSLNRLYLIKNILKEYNADAIIIYKKEDVYYLTNFYDESNSSFLLISNTKNIFITDNRYENKFNLVVKNFDLELSKLNQKKFELINDLLIKYKLKKILLPTEDISYKNVNYLKNIVIKDSSKILKEIRKIKDKDEINNIKKACKIAEKAFIKTLDKIKVGQTEIEIKNLLEEELRKQGAQKESFLTIVASGNYNGASPHSTPTNRKIKKGDLVTIDFGAIYNNYMSDITRTIAIGKIESKKLEVYEIVKKALIETEKILKNGANIKKINEVAKSIIENYGEKLIHGLGHGIGLEIHENPIINGVNNNKLENNEIHTIEPGIYIPGLCGVRIENDYLIKNNGYECLTKKIPIELITI